MKTWEEYLKDQSNTKLPVSPWVPIDVNCPKCGKDSIEVNTSMIYTSAPPKRDHRCGYVQCGFKEIA